MQGAVHARGAPSHLLGGKVLRLLPTLLQLPHNCFMPHIAVGGCCSSSCSLAGAARLALGTPGRLLRSIRVLGSGLQGSQVGITKYMLLRRHSFARHTGTRREHLICCAQGKQPDIGRPCQTVRVMAGSMQKAAGALHPLMEASWSRASCF